MTKDHLRIIRTGLTGSASLDTAVSRAILERVSLGELSETLQLGLPHKVVAFGKHDALTQGFDDAVSIAVEHGFDPTIRLAGGRAVVFHPRVVRFAWTVPATDPVVAMHERFRSVGGHVVTALSTFNVGATLGELPREYCPGSFSVHLDGGGKIMGSGQRLSRKAAQVSGMVVVDDSATINEVLVPIYRILGLDMDPLMTGAVTDVAAVRPETVVEAMALQFADGRETLQCEVETTTMALARTYQPDHDPRSDSTPDPIRDTP